MYEMLEKKLDYTFTDISLLKKAFTHTSIVNEKKLNIINSNQRLEFLGDAVLELCISTYIFSNYPNMLEGDMTKLRASLVCEGSLANLGRKLGLHNFIIMSKGETHSKGNLRESVIADCFEAVLGAIYLDSNFDNTFKIVTTLFKNEVHNKENTFQKLDYKTSLQEKIQAYSQIPIVYKTIDEKGPDHDKVFFVEVYHENNLLGKGSGKSKKEAEQNSAKEAIDKLNK